MGKRVALTDAGERLLPYAEKMLELAREASIVVSGSGHPSGILTIVAPETLCTYRLPPVLREFRTRFPDVTLHLKPNDVGDLRRAMAEDGWIWHSCSKRYRRSQVYGRSVCWTSRLVLHQDKWLSPALCAFLEVTREVLGAAH